MSSPTSSATSQVTGSAAAQPQSGSKNNSEAQADLEKNTTARMAAMTVEEVEKLQDQTTDEAPKVTLKSPSADTKSRDMVRMYRLQLEQQQRMMQHAQSQLKAAKHNDIPADIESTGEKKERVVGDLKD